LNTFLAKYMEVEEPIDSETAKDSRPQLRVSRGVPDPAHGERWESRG